MTLFLEIDRRFAWPPGRSDSRVMRRYWFGFVAFGWIKVPFEEFVTTDYRWKQP